MDSNAGALVLRITYGYRVQEHNDPFINLTEQSIREVTLAASPTSWIVDYLPFRKHFVPLFFFISVNLYN
jgi:hypothetical protein